MESHSADTHNTVEKEQWAQTSRRVRRKKRKTVVVGKAIESTEEL